MNFDRFLPKTVGDALPDVGLSDDDLRLVRHGGGPTDADLVRLERQERRDELRRHARAFLARRRTCSPGPLLKI